MPADMMIFFLFVGAVLVAMMLIAWLGEILRPHLARFDDWIEARALADIAKKLMDEDCAELVHCGQCDLDNGGECTWPDCLRTTSTRIEENDSIELISPTFDVPDDERD